jgi:hypothetical protein
MMPSYPQGGYVDPDDEGALFDDDEFEDDDGQFRRCGARYIS